MNNFSDQYLVLAAECQGESEKMTLDTAIKFNELCKKIKGASLGTVIINVGLIIIALKAQQNGDLWRAWTLVVTSNFVMMIYFIGLRYYYRKMNKLLKSDASKTDEKTE